MKLELTLPGRWFEVELHAEGMPEQLRELTRELLGVHDRDAGARALLHRRILEAAEQARKAKAEQLHLGIALTDEVPIPGTITVYPSIAVSTTRAIDAKSVMDAFIPVAMQTETVPLGGDPVPDAGDRVFAVGDRMFLRRPRLRFDEDRAATPGMLIEYWLTVPETNRVQLVHVSMPEALHTELFTTLFDEIVFASRNEGGTGLRDQLLGS